MHAAVRCGTRDEIAGSAIGYNPRTGTGVATNRYRNEYRRLTASRWSTHNDNWLASAQPVGPGLQDHAIPYIRRHRPERSLARISGDFSTGTGRISSAEISRSTPDPFVAKTASLVGFETGDPRQRGFVGRSEEGDLYAGRDGNVYRRDEDGWSQRGEDGWEPVDVPDDAAAQTRTAPQ